MKKELLKGLTEEQIAKVKQCKNHEELLALAKSENIELTNEQLEAVSGGGVCSSGTDSFCPRCGAPKDKVKRCVVDPKYDWECKKCGLRWVERRYL